MFVLVYLFFNSNMLKTCTIWVSYFYKLDHVSYCYWDVFPTSSLKVELSSSVLHLTSGVGLPVTWHSNVRLPPSWILDLEKLILTSGRPESSRRQQECRQLWLSWAFLVVQKNSTGPKTLILSNSFLATGCSYCMWVRQQCWANIYTAFPSTWLWKALIHIIQTMTDFFLFLNFKHIGWNSIIYIFSIF